MVKRKNKKNKKYVLYISAILVALVLLLALLEKFHVTNFFKANLPATSSNSGPTTDEKASEAKVNAEVKQQSIADDNGQTAPTTNNTSAQTIDLSAKEESTTSVTILSKLYNYSDGTCDLSITNDNMSFTDSADVIYQPEFSSCAGFSVPIEKLGTGSWSIIIKVTSNSKSTTKTITFKVT